MTAGRKYCRFELFNMEKAHSLGSFPGCCITGTLMLIAGVSSSTEVCFPHPSFPLVREGGSEMRCISLLPKMLLTTLSGHIWFYWHRGLGGLWRTKGCRISLSEWDWVWNVTYPSRTPLTHLGCWCWADLHGQQCTERKRHNYWWCKKNTAS